MTPRLYRQNCKFAWSCGSNLIVVANYDWIEFMWNRVQYDHYVPCRKSYLVNSEYKFYQEMYN